MNIRYLTPEQEKKVLELCKGHFEANGSSRAVYRLEIEEAVYAVKVFLDNGGRVQSAAELKMYEALSGEGVLADIYAVGKTCLITEWINYVCEDFIESAVEGNCEWGWQEFNHYEFLDIINAEEMECRVSKVYNVLDDWCGSTGDNTQIGWSHEKQNFVAYDYGYNTETSRHEQVGHMSDYIDMYGYKGVLDEAIEIVDDLAYNFIDYHDDPEYNEERHEICFSCDISEEMDAEEELDF